MQRNRLLLIAAAVGGAAVLAVVLILVASGGSSSHEAAPTTTAAAAQADTTPAAGSGDVFAGVPQKGDTLGKASAPATLTVFEDPQCPYCRQWSVDTLPTVVRDFVRTGKVRLVYRGIEIIGPNSEPALRAIFAAGAQNKLWNVASALYDVQGEENSGWITDDVIKNAAHAAGADGSAILAASPSKKVTAALVAAGKDAVAAQVQGTPTFVLQRAPAVPQQLPVTSLDPQTFSTTLSAALQ
ncbi:MAG TPA: thioredoxin domain-containing protein [Gaiellaceae bacterium]|nr:thioredoxin domain-containing protein [Gaiellaceae bacterium]